MDDLVALLRNIGYSWTLPGLATAVVSGIALGLTAHHFRLPVRVVAWSVAFTGLFWIVPQTVRLLVDPAIHADPGHQSGVALMFLLWFALPVWGTLALMDRRSAA